MPKVLKNALNPKMLDSLTAPGKYADGGGLVFRVDQQGNKVWIQRLTLNAKETSRGLGKYPDVGLARGPKGIS